MANERYVLRILLLQSSSSCCVLVPGRSEWQGRPLDIFLIPTQHARWLDRKEWAKSTPQAASYCARLALRRGRALCVTHERMEYHTGPTLAAIR